MNKKETLETYFKALDKWGTSAQIMMLYEECGELLSAISKLERGRVSEDDVVTELADVSIMVEQIALLFGYDKFEKEKGNKLERLKERLEKHNDNENSETDGDNNK